MVNGKRARTLRVIAAARAGRHPESDEGLLVSSLVVDSFGVLVFTASVVYSVQNHPLYEKTHQDNNHVRCGNSTKVTLH